MSVNKVILLGYVGADPKIQSLNDGTKYAKLSLATSERGFTTASGTQIPDRTEWHNIVAWRGLANLVEARIKKGSRIYVEGKLKTRSYDDNNKVRHYITEVHVDKIEMLGSKSSGNTDSSQSNVVSDSQNIFDEASQQCANNEVDNYINF